MLLLNKSLIWARWPTEGGGGGGLEKAQKNACPLRIQEGLSEHYREKYRLTDIEIYYPENIVLYYFYSMNPCFYLALQRPTKYLS